MLRIIHFTHLDDVEVRINDQQERAEIDENWINEDVASAEPILGQIVGSASTHVSFRYVSVNWSSISKREICFYYNSMNFNAHLYFLLFILSENSPVPSEEGGQGPCKSESPNSKNPQLSPTVSKRLSCKTLDDDVVSVEGDQSHRPDRDAAEQWSEASINFAHEWTWKDNH